MKHRNKLNVLLLAGLLALVVPLAASAQHRPPTGAKTPVSKAPQVKTPYVGLLSSGPSLAVTQLDSAPAGATAGRSYRLGGVVTNHGAKAASGPVVVHLLRPGSRPRVVGRTSVSVRGVHAAGFAVTVRIPTGLTRGSYSLFGCAARLGRTGPLGCVSALRTVRIGRAVSLRGPKVAGFGTKAPLMDLDTCSSGAHTLSQAGDHAYPETGNGGYTSIHTDVTNIYDAPSNLFLSGTNVVLTDQATQCLTDFSLDFERTTNLASDTTAGPNMTVSSVLVNGSPATFAFVQPTYPGDPNGQDDPNPLAHQTGQNTPVSATNPLPPACAPGSNSSSQNGLPCPANKLVVTPSIPIPSGATFTVTVNYTGRPGVHHDGDGTTEGWFRSNSPVGDGGFVTTEPLGTEDWMPLNDHPSAKPTYDFYDTVNLGKQAIANGELISQVDNPSDPQFPSGGSTTFHWHSPEPIAAYLVENSFGAYDLSERIGATGTQWYEAQGSSITAAKKASNKAIMDQQEDITNFQSTFNGTYPATSDGVIIGIPSASFEEEMQTKITFNGGTISLQTFNHENMHQWWGDHVSESNYYMTFYKEGMATLGEYLYLARNAATAAGGIGTPAGDAAFEASLVSRFNGTSNYNSSSSSQWTAAPSNPTPNSLFTTATTYTRPGTAYIALRALLGKTVYNSALQQIQHDYGNGSITEPQLVAEYRQFLPSQSASCNTRLTAFFAQWFDTVYPSGGGLNKPQLTGPGLNGTGFTCATIGLAAPGAANAASRNSSTASGPNGSNGWYTSPVSLTWTGFPTPPTGSTATNTGCVNETLSTDGTFTRSCQVTVANAAGTKTGDSGAVSETIKLDQTAPTTTATIAPATPDGLHNWYLVPPTVTLSAADATSGVASTQVSLDGAPFTAYTGAISPTTEGGHSLAFYSVDSAGNQEATQTIYWAVDTAPPVTTAVLSTTEHNGWYPNPALSFTVNDGLGSGDITDPCPRPPVVCGYSTAVSVDGAAFAPYTTPLHFSTGIHVVQYRTTDDAGRNEATKLIAFKVDAASPTVTITAPADGSVIRQDKAAAMKFKCTDRESGMDACFADLYGPGGEDDCARCPSGSAMDTSKIGAHRLVVTATDKAGNVTTKTVDFTVVFTWNGFFAPVVNTADSKLNLVHAGDMVPLGFGLNGDRGLNVLNYPPPDRSTVIACPAEPVVLQKARSGGAAGLSYSSSSGHYTFVWQTSTTWAGTCRRFTLQTNDGTAAHTADFMFFA